MDGLIIGVMRISRFLTICSPTSDCIWAELATADNVSTMKTDLHITHGVSTLNSMANNVEDA